MNFIEIINKWEEKQNINILSLLDINSRCEFVTGDVVSVMNEV